MSENDNDIPSYMRDQDLADDPALGHESDPKRSASSEMGNPTINYAAYKAIGKGLESSARVTDDGRIVVNLNLKQILPDLPEDYAKDVKEFAVERRPAPSVPKMSIVIMIVGSRGDVQPYLALAKKLIEHGHRVRLATHETFCSFVREAGVEFFNIGGDPKDLMSYMVKNPGLMPGFDSLTNGDIGRKRRMISQMLEGCWKSCYENDSETDEPFAADAIIANPPSFAHVHCAEALGLPLQMSFTMPWCPTTAFPHPLVNVQQSNAKKRLTNYLSYALVDILTWQGMGDVINRFRTKSLGLLPLTLRSGPGIVDRLKIPWTYCLSPSLIPKPDDWKNHIDLVGFYFLKLSEGYEPPEDLRNFLESGPPPVYIGFGSVVVENAEVMTKTIFSAISQSGVRALVSAGWGGIGSVSVPSNVFILGNVPHDWLFSKVSAVCHHGGAGTTAIGLLMGKPTIVVPFFGDQPFWGEMIYQAGAGPQPIPHKMLNADNLAAAIKFTQTPAAQKAAKRMGSQIRQENGTEEGINSFYRHLPLQNMRCDLDPTLLAEWWSTEHCLRLSAFAAQTLADARLIDIQDLDPHRPKEYETHSNISDPITGGGTAIFWTVTHYYAGIAQIFYNPKKGIINVTTAIPRGVMKIVLSVHEGLVNVPKLYGSEVRNTGTAHDFKSGLRKAGKDFFYGYYDGITGLVKEPMQGAQKEGFLGAVKGSLRSFVNVNMRPAAGAVGLIATPLQGIFNSLQSRFSSGLENKQRRTRIHNGKVAVQNGTPEEKNVIVRAFKAATDQAKVKERKDRYRTMAEEVLKESVESVGDGETASKVGQSIEGTSTLTESSAGETATFKFEPTRSSSPSGSRSPSRPARRK